MGITIKHLEGPLAGQEQYFDDTVEEIDFGRSSICAVRYPPEFRNIKSRHFALNRRPDGHYYAVLLSTGYVDINGDTVAGDYPRVTSGSVIRLGSDGPSFKVKIEGEIAEAWALAERSRVAAMPVGRSLDNVVAKSDEWEDRMEVQGRGKFRREDQPEMVADAAEPVPADDIVVPREPHRALGSRAGWWVAAGLAAAAVLAYAYLMFLLFRRDSVFGAALGNLFQAAPFSLPSAKSETAELDLVDVSVFGPKALRSGGSALIQVFLHQLDQRETAFALAQETDPDAARRGVRTLAAEIQRGQNVTVMLEGRGLAVDQEMRSLVWRGEPCACQFTVEAPKGSAGSTFHPRVLILVNSVPIGSVTFALKVASRAPRQRKVEVQGDRASRYAYAFLSYASPDRAEVLKRAQGLKAGGTDFFQDLLSLEPGERWRTRLYQEIDRCDVFYLFWSSQAKASEWVMKETEYALARRDASEDERPDIVPVIIEGPPPPAPPDTLRDLHFNDCLLYVLAATSNDNAKGHTNA